MATTKAYTTQLVLMDLVGLYLADLLGMVEQSEYDTILSEMQLLPEKMRQFLSHTEDIQYYASRYFNHDSIFFIGRNLDYAMGLEGSLKLKEISYIHAEAYAAGELKHGTIALITEEVPVIAIATQEKVFAKTISNIREVKARGAFVILITREDAVLDGGIADIHIRIPKIGDRFTVFPIAVVLQLIAYYASTGKNLDVDQPRNLAKSVTVE